MARFTPTEQAAKLRRLSQEFNCNLTPEHVARLPEELKLLSVDGRDGLCLPRIAHILAQIDRIEREVAGEQSVVQRSRCEIPPRVDDFEGRGGRLSDLVEQANALDGP